MRIPRCAPSWLAAQARSLVRRGLDSPELVQVDRVDGWGLVFYWKHTPAYSALAYCCDGAFDRRMKLQVLDAFTRGCKRPLVAIVHETPVSAVCFFGGVPEHVSLPTPNYALLDIRYRRFSRRQGCRIL